MQSFIQWVLNPFTSYIGPLLMNALLELVVISLVGAIVGTFIVLRGLAFMVDALSHAIFPGVVVAFLIGANFLVGAVVAALIVTLLISQTVRRSQVSDDSAIGIFFTGAFAFGVALLSSQKSYGRSLADFLFGDILGVSVADVVVTLGLGVVVGGIVYALRKALILTAFDPQMSRAMGLPVAWLDLLLFSLIAVTVVVALPAVGNVLVLAFLVTPAATARLLTDRLVWMVALATFFGIVSSVVGLYLSYYAAFAGSATIVVVATVFFGLTLLFSPTHGLLSVVMARQQRMRIPNSTAVTAGNNQ